jgi:UDP-N-acetylglucosamine diphosphorylase/glucosamine-1-phosphate N-acetyltransferase
MKINLFETADNHFLLPLTYFKHISDLRLGCSSLAEKWQAFGLETCKVGRHYLNSDQPDATVWINARVLANQKLVDEIHKLAPNSALTTNDQIIAINTNQKMKQDKHGFIQLSDIERSLINTRNYNFTLLDFAWDFISYNAQEIEADISRLPKQAWQEQAASDKTNHRLFVSKTATISTNVVLDSHAGSIWIDDDAIIEPFVVIKGPCYIGKKTIVKSHTSITNSSIHENCRSAGEISTSIQLEFSNKGHDGFLGQSILGSWTNLGAGTTTSNLKNNYSNVNVDFFGKRKDISLQFLGLILGDHSKSAIGTLFNTATIIGACCNIFGHEMPSKFTPSFSWGSTKNQQIYQLDKAFETAKNVMERRGVFIDHSYMHQLKAVLDLANQFEQS